EVDGADAAVGGLLAQQPRHRHAPAGVDLHGEGRAGLRIAGAFRPRAEAAAPRLAARRPALLVGCLARDQAVVVGHVVVVGDDDAAPRIDGDPAPVRTAVVAG